MKYLSETTRRLGLFGASSNDREAQPIPITPLWNTPKNTKWTVTKVSIYFVGDSGNFRLQGDGGTFEQIKYLAFNYK